MRIDLDKQAQRLVQLARSKVAETDAFKRGVDHGVTSVLNTFLSEIATAEGVTGEMELTPDGTALVSIDKKE